MGTSVGTGFIDTAGKLWTAGLSQYGQLGYVGTESTLQDTGITGVKQAVKGNNHMVILNTAGQAFTIGTNYYGQCGHGINVGVNTANVRRMVMENVKEIAAGGDITLILTNSGVLYGCGRNAYGALGANPNTGAAGAVSSFRTLATNVKSIAAGRLTSYWVTTTGQVIGMGYGVNYALGGNNNTSTTTPRSIISATSAIDRVFAGGVDFAFALRESDGRLWGWGYNTYGQLGTGDTNVRTSPNILISSGVEHVAAGNYHTMVIQNLSGTSRRLMGAGYNLHGQLGVPNNFGTATANNNFLVMMGSGIRHVECGQYHTMIVNDSNVAMAFGNNGNGQLGRGFLENTNHYDRVPIKNDVRVAIGSQLSNFASLDISDDSVTPFIHHQPASLTATINNSAGAQVRYRVLVNNVQRFPESGFTGYVDSPHTLTVNLDNSFFSLGNNNVALEYESSDGLLATSTYLVNKYNNLPTVTMTLPPTVHKNNATIQGTITDPDGDTVQYRVLRNGVQIFPTEGEWTELMDVPISYNHTVLNSNLNMGANSITIQARDGLGMYTNSWTLTKVNANPDTTGGIFGTTIKATVTDPDEDQVRYRIFLNEIQVFPSEGFTQFYNTPFNIDYRLPYAYMLIGQNNVVRVSALDDMGGLTEREFNFLGDYAGLMFCDEAESYYSTDVGEILKYLDFGTITAGGDTETARVFIKNTLGYPVNNIRVWPHHGDLDGVEAKVEVSKFDAPFEAEDVVVYPETINHGERISFYVRVTTTRSATSGGNFDIISRADPAQ